MALFPMFVKLRDRLCVVVGGGQIAEAKIPGLLAAEAKIRIIAPEVTESLASRARDGQIEWLRKKFEPADFPGAYLVVAATSDVAVNHEIFREAEALGILCNAVDDPDYCHFYYPSVVRRGALQIAISTEGLSPRLRSVCGASWKRSLGLSTSRGSIGWAPRGDFFAPRKRIPKKRGNCCINLRARKCSHDFCGIPGGRTATGATDEAGKSIWWAADRAIPNC